MKIGINLNKRNKIMKALKLFPLVLLILNLFGCIFVTKPLDDRYLNWKWSKAWDECEARGQEDIIKCMKEKGYFKHVKE